MYVPSKVPAINNTEELRQFVETELRQLSQSLLNNDFLQVNVLYVEPIRPRNGMVVYADGTIWNPGAGEGFYGREAGAWVKL